MGDNEYLKKLKESLEKGVQDRDVVNMHYEILQGADLEQRVRQAKAKDNDLYTTEILNYVTDKNDILGNEKKRVEVEKEIERNKEEHAAYTDEIKNYIGDDMPIDVTKKLIDQAKVLEQFDADRIKKERIELNTYQIKLLNEDSDKLRMKIQKNNELVKYLIDEITKFT